MTVVSAKSFPDGASLPLVADIQYREPYSSAAFNRKLRGILGMGLYKGLYPMPGSGLNLLISSQDSGDTSGTASFDIGDDYQITVRQQADITIAMTAGTSKIVALQCVFGLGIETYQVNSSASVQAAEIVLLDAGSALASNQLELGVVTIPADATQITTDMIDVSGRILQTIGIELSSAIDDTSETVAANSYAIKRALDYVAGKFALLGSNADITSMSALTSITGSALSISGALALGSTLSVTNAAAFNSDITVGGKLTAAGATTLASTLNVTGATTLSSTLDVSDALTAQSTLSVTGATTLNSALLAKSTLDVTGTSTLAGALVAKSTLMLTGAAALSSHLTVAGNLTVAGSVTLINALPVSSGGTGSTTAANARSALGAAASGSNADITALTSLYSLILNSGTLNGVATQGSVLSGTESLVVTSSVLKGLMGTGSVNDSGYLTIPTIIGGNLRTFYLQWGSYTGTTSSSAGADGVYENSGVWVSWPITFPNGVLQVLTGGSSDVGGAGQQEMSWVLAKQQTGATFGFQCRTASATMTGAYLAIGW